MTAARGLAQPGPARPERWIAAAGPVRDLAFTLEPGLTVNAAITGPLIAAGFAGGTVELAGGAFGPFTYVMPALSVDPRYAAFYSESYRPAGVTRLERAVATFGTRDGAPFVHCHGLWREADGARRGGHVMPLDTIVAEGITAKAVGTGVASFTVLPDPETNFSLFTPVQGEPAAPAGRRAVLLKIQPNAPIEDAILAACRAHGLAAARILGIGSLVGAAFADGRFASSVATEILLGPSRVALAPDGTGAVTLDIALVDVAGSIHEGRLAPGNPVCITCELCLVET